MGPKLTRRAILGAIPVVLLAQANRTTTNPIAKKSRPLPAVGEFTRLTDSLTENVVVRLTSPTYSSRLTAMGNQFVSVKERSLLFSSNRTGHMAPFQVDLRNGALKQIADAEKLDPRSLCLDRAQKSAYFLDDNKLREAPLGKGNPQTLAENASWFRLRADGILFLIQNGKLLMREGAGWKHITEPAISCWPQPNGAGCLFARSYSEQECEFWYAPLQSEKKAVLMASGRIRDPFWDADGDSILFIRDVTNAAGALLSEIHGLSLSGEPEKWVSSTSQFATFSPNADDTVFVGASRSRAQPAVVLMLRTPNREMTLCEHGSKRPADVLPAFSPDSRRVYFESEHEGNPAIYSVNVESLVEPVSSGA